MQGIVQKDLEMGGIVRGIGYKKSRFEMIEAAYITGFG